MSPISLAIVINDKQAKNMPCVSFKETGDTLCALDLIFVSIFEPVTNNYINDSDKEATSLKDKFAKSMTANINKKFAYNSRFAFL